MQKILATLLFFVSFQLNAQTYPVTGITISLPSNPPSTIAKWGTGASTLTISANGKTVNGRPDIRVEGSRILVEIKKAGSKICGSYTSATAPSTKFTSSNKFWRGNDAVSLFGQDCTLPPGDYEMCVRIFATGAKGTEPISEDECKAFSISGKETQSYQSPQPMSPSNGFIFSENNLRTPITFRWTPVIPKPRDPFTYRLKVWQLMQGQTGAQAVKTNQPIITKDVDNLTQANVDNLVNGPCKPPHLCEFIWNIQALDRDGKPIGGTNGMNDAFSFRIKIVEIKGDESPENASGRRNAEKK